MRRSPGKRLVTLLTGERGAGKTTVCLRVGHLAPEAGLQVAGIVSSCGDPLRERLDAVDLSTLERWLLASAGEPLGGPAVGRFSFSAAGLARARAALEQAAASDAALVVLDEVGPLELRMHDGFYPFLERLRALDSPDLLLAVRPSLLSDLQGFLAGERQIVLEVNAEARESLPRRILEAARREV